MLLISFLKVVVGDYSTGGLIKVYNDVFGLLNSFQAHTSWVNRIKQTPFQNNDFVATCSFDKKAKIWNKSNIYSWSLVRTYSQHSSEIIDLEWLDEDTLASSGVADNIIKIWSVSTGQTKRNISTYANVFSLKLVSPWSSLFYLAAGLNGSINVYNLNDGSLVSTLKGHTGNVMDLVLINDEVLASSSEDSTVRIWDLATNTCKFTLQGHGSQVYGIKLISFDILASGAKDNQVKIWNITSGNLIRTLTGHTSSIWWSLDLMHNGQTLVSVNLQQKQ